MEKSIISFDHKQIKNHILLPLTFLWNTCFLVLPVMGKLMLSADS